MGGYREAASRDEPREIVVSLPRKRGALVVFPIVIGLWVLFVFGGGGTDRLHCEDGRCTARTAYVWVIAVEEVRFLAEDIVSSDHHGNRNEVRVRLYRRDRPMIELNLNAFTGDSEYEALRTYLADPTGAFSVTASPSIFLWFMIGIGVFVLGGIVRSVYKAPSTITLLLHHDAIEATERWPFRARHHRLELDSPTEVRLLEQRVSTWLDGDRDGVVVQLVDSDGRVRAVTEAYPDSDALRRLADSLREGLGLED